MTGSRLIVLVFLFFGPHNAMAAWITRDQSELGLNPVAYVTATNGQRAEIFVGDSSAIFLRLILGEGFETFAESNCPTFQIDNRVPMHHFEVGDRCVIVAKRATYMLGQIVDQEITSLILHRFMNGNQVTFRYTAKNGQYRQANFSLSNSKQALMHALGSDIRILVD